MFDLGLVDHTTPLFQVLLDLTIRLLHLHPLILSHLLSESATFVHWTSRIVWSNDFGLDTGTVIFLSEGRGLMDHSSTTVLGDIGG